MNATPILLLDPAQAIRRLLALTLVAFAGCYEEPPTPTPSSKAIVRSPAKPSVVIVDPHAIVLSPHAGNRPIDLEIRRRQGEVRAGVQRDAALERMGWLYIAKARATFDPGFYKLAEQCALALDPAGTNPPATLLLRGHALHSQHRFIEAEQLATQLVTNRGLASDYGLLGDVLVDLGRVAGATEAYQQMLDLKPDPQGFARAAHIRWLKGDLAGAEEAMDMAAQAVSPRDPEAAAWMHTQWARYLWQSGAINEATRALQIALELNAAYPPALHLRGRMLLAVGRASDAIVLLREAAAAQALPEYLWTLAEALAVAGEEVESAQTEARLMRRGVRIDPRTVAVFLATRGQQVETALQFASQEHKERQDVFTHDALAWALAAAGRLDEAHDRMSLALAEGTQDARLLMHATVLAAKAGRSHEAQFWHEKAVSLRNLLLPTEAAQLDAIGKVCLAAERTAALQRSPDDSAAPHDRRSDRAAVLPKFFPE